MSTADADHRVTASQAMKTGLAPDGRLYIPVRFPALELADFDGLDTLPEIGARMLEPFFEGDVLAPRVREICEEAFDFPVPLKRLTRDTSVLELFHGPTAAFKDIGARFLASCLSRLNEREDEPLTILVATSGDTGGAVAAAFVGKPNVEVIILYPKGMVSARQERQLTCWEQNIRTFAVRGVFDDCQRMVKGAFAHPWWRQNVRLSSANSINIGRLLPQMVYYAASSLWYWRETGVRPGYVIPSGNVGNVCACLWARASGLPIGDVTIATNENRPIPDFLATGTWEPRDTVQTLASAMDVGRPSNMERVRAMHPTLESLRAAVRAYAVTDPEIRAQIQRGERAWGEVWCPHTACAVQVREQLDEPHRVIVATAHPAKFDVIVEPLVGHEIEVPPELARLLEMPNHATEIPADLDALTNAIASEAP